MCAKNADPKDLLENQFLRALSKMESYGCVRAPNAKREQQINVLAQSARNALGIGALSKALDHKQNLNKFEQKKMYI